MQCNHHNARLRPYDYVLQGVYCPDCETHIQLFEWQNQLRNRVAELEKKLAALTEFVEAHVKPTV